MSKNIIKPNFKYLIFNNLKIILIFDIIKICLINLLILYKVDYHKK